MDFNLPFKEDNCTVIHLSPKIQVPDTFYLRRESCMPLKLVGTPKNHKSPKLSKERWKRRVNKHNGDAAPLTETFNIQLFFGS